MKKILTMLLIVVTVFSLSITASATNPITVEGGSDTADVKATYVPAPDTYRVQIMWRDLEFNYVETWNTMVCKNDYRWEPNNVGGNIIEVSNQSNVAITAKFVYNQDSTVTGVNGSFSNNTVDIAVGAGNCGTMGQTELTLLGEPSNINLNDTTVGSVTVTINKKK